MIYRTLAVILVAFTSQSVLMQDLLPDFTTLSPGNTTSDFNNATEVIVTHEQEASATQTSSPLQTTPIDDNDTTTTATAFKQMEDDLEILNNETSSYDNGRGEAPAPDFVIDGRVVVVDSDMGDNGQLNVHYIKNVSIHLEGTHDSKYEEDDDEDEEDEEDILDELDMLQELMRIM